jgi:hypothetical protein
MIFALGAIFATSVSSASYPESFDLSHAVRRLVSEAEIKLSSSKNLDLKVRVP